MAPFNLGANGRFYVPGGRDLEKFLNNGRLSVDEDKRQFEDFNDFLDASTSMMSVTPENAPDEIKNIGSLLSEGRASFRSTDQNPIMGLALGESFEVGPGSVNLQGQNIGLGISPLNQSVNANYRSDDGSKSVGVSFSNPSDPTAYLSFQLKSPINQQGSTNAPDFVGDIPDEPQSSQNESKKNEAQQYLENQLEKYLNGKKNSSHRYGIY